MEQNEKLSYFVTETIVTERADLFITKKFPQLKHTKKIIFLKSKKINIKKKYKN